MAATPSVAVSDGGSFRTRKDLQFSFGRAPPPTWGIGEAPRSVEEHRFRHGSPRGGHATQDMLGQASPDWQLTQSSSDNDSISGDNPNFHDAEDDVEEHVEEDNGDTHQAQVTSAPAANWSKNVASGLPLPDHTPSLIGGVPLVAPLTHPWVAVAATAVQQDAGQLPISRPFSEASQASRAEPTFCEANFDWNKGIVSDIFKQGRKSDRILMAAQETNLERSGSDQNDFVLPLRRAVVRACLSHQVSEETNQGQGANGSSLYLGIHPDLHLSASGIPPPQGRSTTEMRISNPQVSDEPYRGQGEANESSLCGGVHSEFDISSSSAPTIQGCGAAEISISNQDSVPPRHGQSVVDMSISNQGSAIEHGDTTISAGNGNHDLARTGSGETATIQANAAEDPLILSAELLCIDGSTVSSLTSPSTTAPATPHIFAHAVPGNNPRQILHYLYGQLPSKKQLSKSDYFTWEDDTRGHHNKRFTCIFVCPLTRDIFPSGQYGITVAEIGPDGAIWHKTKKDAENAAAARACDYLFSRNKLPGPFEEDGQPYVPSNNVTTEIVIPESIQKEVMKQQVEEENLHHA